MCRDREEDKVGDQRLNFYKGLEIKQGWENLVQFKEHLGVSRGNHTCTCNLDTF